MVSAATKPSNIPPETTLAEQRVVFHNISWQAYEQILAALGEGRSSRLIYDRGTLEITMPLEEHIEKIGSTINWNVIICDHV